MAIDISGEEHAVTHADEAIADGAVGPAEV